MSEAQIIRRANGRRYNSVRKFQAGLRRQQVFERLNQVGFFAPGIQARLARKLGVSRSTICRDVASLMPAYKTCPCCGTLVPAARLA